MQLNTHKHCFTSHVPSVWKNAEGQAVATLKPFHIGAQLVMCNVMFRSITTVWLTIRGGYTQSLMILRNNQELAQAPMKALKVSTLILSLSGQELLSGA